MARLRPAQRAFAIEYARTEQPLQSALTAGYSPKGAPSRATALLAKPEVRDLINRERALRVDPTDLTRLQHILVLGVMRDKAAADHRWQAVAKLEDLRGKALGFQPGGVKAGEPTGAALSQPPEVDWDQLVMGRPAKAIGAPNASSTGVPEKGLAGAGSKALSKTHIPEPPDGTPENSGSAT